MVKDKIINWINRYKRDLVWALCVILISGTGVTYYIVANNGMRVHNLLNYGGKLDGRRLYDATITANQNTITSNTANWTTADIGKKGRTKGGGATDHDVIFTITAITSSTIAVTNQTWTTTHTTDTLVYGTDNTSALRAAVQDDSADGGGVVYIPSGVNTFFVIAGPLITSYAGANPNCQIPIPVVDFAGVNNSIHRTRYIFKGETGPDFTTESFADTLPAFNGSILYDIIDGSGNMPAMFGTQAPNSGNGNYNYNMVEFQDLTIYVPQNITNGGASIGGINMWYAMATKFTNVQVSSDGSILYSVTHTNVCAGIITNGISAEIESSINDCYVFDFPYGILVSDECYVNNAFIFLCNFGLVFPANEETVTVSSVHIHWCINDIYVPTVALGGIPAPNSQNCHFNITSLSSEIFRSSTHWYNNVFIISDSGNAGTGNVYYDLTQAAGTWQNKQFTMKGGQGIQAECFGVNTSWYTRMFGPNFGAQSFGSNASAILNNMYLNDSGGFFTAKQLGTGQQLDFSGTTGGMFIRIWPTTAAGSSPASQMFPMILDSNGNIGFGNSSVQFIAPFTGLTLQALANKKVTINGNDNSTGQLQVTSTTQAQIALQYDNSDYTQLTTGSTGNMTAKPSGGLWAFNAGMVYNTTITAASTYTITVTDHTVIGTGTTSTWTFPSATGGRFLILTNHGSGNVTLGTAVTTGNGASTTTLAPATSFQITWDATNSVWRKVNDLTEFGLLVLLPTMLYRRMKFNNMKIAA